MDPKALGIVMLRDRVMTIAGTAALSLRGPVVERAQMSPADLAELGRRIRKLRIEQRLTLKQVETASGLSATHLSEIERGRTSPTIGALIRIARALGKRPSFFMETEELAEVALVPVEGARSWTLPGGVRIHALTPGIPGSELFSYRLELRAGSEWRRAAHPTPGHAIFYVLGGAIEAHLGDEALTIEAGDAIEAPLTIPHRLRARGAEPAHVLAMLTHSLEPRS
jgi:transcriptional regulator with XRE-family HTH domain